MRARTHGSLCGAPQVDPPAFCTESGAATSIDELNDRTERSLLNRRPGSAIKSWRWKEVRRRLRHFRIMLGCECKSLRLDILGCLPAAGLAVARFGLALCHRLPVHLQDPPGPNVHGATTDVVSNESGHSPRPHGRRRCGGGLRHRRSSGGPAPRERARWAWRPRSPLRRGHRLQSRARQPSMAGVRIESGGAAMDQAVLCRLRHLRHLPRPRRRCESGPPAAPSILHSLTFLIFSHALSCPNDTLN